MTNVAFTVTAYQSAFLAVNNDNDDGVAMAAQGSQPTPPLSRCLLRSIYHLTSFSWGRKAAVTRLGRLQRVVARQKCAFAATSKRQGVVSSASLVCVFSPSLMLSVRLQEASRQQITNTKIKHESEQCYYIFRVFRVCGTRCPTKWCGTSRILREHTVHYRTQ